MIDFIHMWCIGMDVNYIAFWFWIPLPDNRSMQESSILMQYFSNWVTCICPDWLNVFLTLWVEYFCSVMQRDGCKSDHLPILLPDNAAVSQYFSNWVTCICPDWLNIFLNISVLWCNGMDVNQITFRFSSLTMQPSRDPEVRLGQSVSGLRPRPQYVFVHICSVYMYHLYLCIYVPRP